MRSKSCCALARRAAMHRSTARAREEAAAGVIQFRTAPAPPEFLRHDTANSGPDPEPSRTSPPAGSPYKRRRREPQARRFLAAAAESLG